MKKSIKVDQKKKRGRPPSGRGTMVSSRFPAPVVDAVDDWALKSDTTRSDAIRRLVELGLAGAAKSSFNRPSKMNAAKAKELAANTLDGLSDKRAPAEEQASRKRHLLKGVDRAKAKGK